MVEESEAMTLTTEPRNKTMNTSRNTRSATYLVEFYTKSETGVPGSNILFARTVAGSEKEAAENVRANWPVSFDCVITCDEVSADFLPDCECAIIR